MKGWENTVHFLSSGVKGLMMVCHAAILMLHCVSQSNVYWNLDYIPAAVRGTDSHWNTASEHGACPTCPWQQTEQFGKISTWNIHFSITYNFPPIPPSTYLYIQCDGIGSWAKSPSDDGCREGEKIKKIRLMTKDKTRSSFCSGDLQITY